MVLESNRIPSLDGLRAISITLVILFHLGILAQPAYGNLGVRVFFVISGYLITGILLKEWDRTGSISLKNFYARRAIRIFPAFYVYVSVMALCAAWSFITLAHYDIVRAATYTINFYPGPTQSLYVRHIWSLAIEEQFYIIWPVLMFLAGRRGALKAAAVFLAMAPVIRLIYWFLVPSMHDVMDRRFETVADALAAGCVLAGIQSTLSTLQIYNAKLRSRAFYLLPASIIPIALLTDSRPRTYYGIGITILNVSIAICIDRFVRYPDDRVGQLLNSNPLSFIGRLSYSIYLWQQPFLDFSAVHSFSLLFFRIVCAAAASLVSYYVIERPLLRLRNRFSRQPNAAVVRTVA